jgi:hypothetical protein
MRQTHALKPCAESFRKPQTYCGQTDPSSGESFPTKRRSEKSPLPAAHWRGGQLRNLPWIEERLEMNVAQQERLNRFPVLRGGRLLLRSSPPGSEQQASQYNPPPSKAARSAHPAIPNHPCSLSADQKAALPVQNTAGPLS